MPFIVNVSGEGVTPGAGLPTTIAPDTNDASGVEFALGLGTANVAT
jgi:hypothetical protein